MDNNTTKKTQRSRESSEWQTALLEKYTLEELEAKPELLTMIPEDQREAWLENQKALQTRLDEIREMVNERFYSLWVDVEKQAREKYGLSEDEYVEFMARAPELDSMSLWDFRRQSMDDQGGLLIGGLLDTILKRAQEENRPVNEIIQDIQEALERGEAPKITIKRPDSVEYPIDKINNGVWRLLETDTGGQLTFAAEKKGSKEELNITYSINFDRLEETGINITKKLSAIDKRIYIAAASLYNAGNKVTTLRQIHYAMGNTTRPAPDQLQKILTSIKKMKAADIIVDNASEAAVYKKYGAFRYEGSLFPAEFFEGYTVQGGLTDAAVHLFREPPLVSFSKQRKQITTVPIKVLQSPLNKTEAHLAIDDYLIERIARIKGPDSKKQDKHGNGRILYKTICDHARITGKQKQRLPGTVQRYLKHYQECGMITKYTQKADGVTIFF